MPRPPALRAWRFAILMVSGAVFAATVVGSTPASFRETSAPPGVPFGPNELAPAAYGRPYTGSKIRLTSSLAVAQLRVARAAGIRVTIRLAGKQRNYQNPDGSFSLSRWKEQIARFRNVPLGKFIADGTIVAHQIVSEAKAPNQWGGTVITNDVLDQMARYSKSIWPSMPTVVRTDASDLEKSAAGYRVPQPGWVWKYLDAASSRYLAHKGDVDTYARNEQASADRQKLSLVTGLNALTGGDGSSRFRSPAKRGAWVMSASELFRYVPALLSHTRSCAFEIWRYASDPIYFETPDILIAMDFLTALARTFPSYRCSARAPGRTAAG